MEQRFDGVYQDPFKDNAKKKRTDKRPCRTHSIMRG